MVAVMVVTVSVMVAVKVALMVLFYWLNRLCRQKVV